MLYLIIFTLIVFLAFLYNAYDYHKTSHEFLVDVSKSKDKDVSDLAYKIEELKKENKIKDVNTKEAYYNLHDEEKNSANLEKYIRRFKGLKVITEEVINGNKYIIHTETQEYNHVLDITVETFDEYGYVNYEKVYDIDDFIEKLRESKKPDYELIIEDKNYCGMDYIRILLNGGEFFYEGRCYGALLNSFNDVKNLYSDWESGV